MFFNSSAEKAVYKANSPWFVQKVRAHDYFLRPQIRPPQRNRFVRRHGKINEEYTDGYHDEMLVSRIVEAGISPEIRQVAL
jgi:hypothetical protein